MPPSASALFRAFRSRTIALPNRVVMAPMTRSFAIDGVPGDDVVAYYARRAASGAQGDFSSHSPVTMPARRPGDPNVVWDVAPATWPATLRMISRMARPIATAAPGTPPRQP